MKPLSDDQFIKQFENQTLNPAYFDHQGHVRIARLYLQQYPFSSAVEKTLHGIQAYAASLGASDKFHATISTATLYLLAAQIENNETPAVTDEDSELVTDLLGLLKQFYSEERLFSAQAKQQFIEADKKPLPPIIDKQEQKA
ncbi:hypothetical protein [Thiomicrorhabdus sediminis]|uniref:Uncharacterized protein n=1 Tax=Thiomicrorhabdus sediminis TaxID=2580412 RepID=A0A4P9K5C5_9GAMM|nr:hypothetical protein [Thiomicrorhabdus sediminis]QCU90058.1 hypothetical protein FE785_05125 [Thiomicrorhabdus sediminis]